MLLFFVIAASLVATTVAIHAYGTLVWIRFLVRGSRTRLHPGFWNSWSILAGTGVFLVGLHLVEAIIWAETYRLLPTDKVHFSTWEEAVYFSLVTFTTLGYGDVTLEGDWRVLSGVQAVNGIILVGWSTAVLFSVFQRLWLADLKEMQDREFER